MTDPDLDNEVELECDHSAYSAVDWDGEFATYQCHGCQYEWTEEYRDRF